MRDGRSGETKCVPETNLITPAMGQNSRHPHPLLHGNTHASGSASPPDPAALLCAGRSWWLAPPSITLTAVEIHPPCCAKACAQHRVACRNWGGEKAPEPPSTCPCTLILSRSSLGGGHKRGRGDPVSATLGEMTINS